MIVVSDASPLIALHALGMIELARQYFGEIIVPEAVFAELRSLQSVGGEDTERMIPGLIVRSVQNRTEVSRLLDLLGTGESEAIALAQELHADVLLIDERVGRAIASDLGLRIIGVVGILLEAKHRGDIGAVSPQLKLLAEKIEFRISPELKENVLRAAGELPPPSH